MLKEVYFHTDASNRIFYIGSGIKGRAERCDLIGRGQDYLDYVEKHGFGSIQKVTSFIDENDAKSLEYALITALYKTEPLVNKYLNRNYKKKIRTETRELQSKVRKGVPWTEAARAKPRNHTRKGIKIIRVSCIACQKEMGKNNFPQHVRNKHA